MSLTWGKVRDFDYQHLAQWAEFFPVRPTKGVPMRNEPLVKDEAGSRHAEKRSDNTTNYLTNTYTKTLKSKKGGAEAQAIEAPPAIIGIHLAGTPPRNSGKSEGSPVELPSVFRYPWKAFLVGICFWAVIYRLWK
jgi:hypothetical protein